MDEASRDPLPTESTEVGAGEVGEVQDQAEGGRGTASPAGSQPLRPGVEPMAVEAEQPDPILTAARRIAFLPVVHGGLGLRSSALLSPAAYWAAWADMLPTLVERVPDLAEQVLQTFFGCRSWRVVAHGSRVWRRQQQRKKTPLPGPSSRSSRRGGSWRLASARPTQRRRTRRNQANGPTGGNSTHLSDL